jgi:hypothetical protein
LIFTKKWIGLHFGRLFHKRIWSPWLGFLLQVTGFTALLPPWRFFPSEIGNRSAQDLSDGKIADLHMYVKRKTAQMGQSYLARRVESSLKFLTQLSRVARFFLIQHTKTGKIYPKD